MANVQELRRHYLTLMGYMLEVAGPHELPPDEFWTRESTRIFRNRKNMDRAARLLYHWAKLSAKSESALQAENADLRARLEKTEAYVVELREELGERTW